jgi:predicted double-glycine peptidase
MWRIAMSEFHLLSRCRQMTDYSCGASALRIVLGYWGRDVDEAELMELLHTNAEIGTDPEDIVNGARSLGFDAQLFENLTLDELDRLTADGNPVIVLGQMWRSERELDRPLEDVWDNGHYVVVLGVDKDYVYLQDPYIQMGKAFATRKSFEDHWHQVMGGNLEKSRKLIHLGIVIRSKQPAKKIHSSPEAPELDFSNFGSFNLIVTELDRYLLPFDFLDEVQSIWEDASVRPNAFILLRRDKDGSLSGMEGSRLEQGSEIVAMSAAMAAMADCSLGSPEHARASALAAAKSAIEGDFGLPAETLKRIAEKLPANHSVVIGIFENVWERKLRDVAKRHGGRVTNQGLMSSEDIARAIANGAR